MKDKQARIERIDSLSPEEKEKYFDTSHIYIVQLADGRLESFGDLAALYLATGDTKYDKSVHIDDWCGKAEIDARGNIATEITIAEAREKKKAEINTTAEEKILAIQAHYLEGEKSTFDIQRKGAADILNGIESIEAEWIVSLVERMNRIAEKETNVMEYAEKIQTHVKADNTAIAEILGIKKGLCAKIEAQNTLSKINAVCWPVEA